MRHKSNVIKTFIGLAIGVFFVWLSASEWPLDRILGRVSVSEGHVLVGGGFIPHTAEDVARLHHVSGWTVELFWLLPYIATLIAVHFLRVIRWRPLLDPIVRLSFKEHNRIGAVGFMAMFLFPLRLGELVRPYLVKRATGSNARMTAVLATVVVERVVDGLVVALMLVAILTQLPATDPSVALKLEVGALAALAVFLGATVLLLAARWKHDLARQVLKRTVGLISSKVAGAIDTLVGKFLTGLQRLPGRRELAWFLFLTLVYWALNGIGVYCMARAFYLPVDVWGAYAMMCCVVVGMMIPNPPGNLGNFWYFLLLPVLLYGVTQDSTQALAFGLAVWFLQLLQQTAFGAWFILRGEVSWRGVVAATYEDEATIADPEVARV